MFELNTERLKIVALDYENFKLHIENNGELQRKLKVVITKEKLEDWFGEVMAEPLKVMINDLENQYFYTNWQVILKQENKVVAGICFKGPPDENGKVEIGYGTEESHQNRGIISEAIKKVVEWAFEQKNIKIVSAETDFDNIVSQKVLINNGFKKKKEYDDLFYFEINKQSYSFL